MTGSSLGNVKQLYHCCWNIFANITLVAETTNLESMALIALGHSLSLPFAFLFCQHILINHK